jgi:Na+/proline symporter
MGVILGSGVAPIALCITWSRANKTGCIVGALAGFAAGIIAWLVTTSTLNGGVINVVVRFRFLFCSHETATDSISSADQRRCAIFVLCLDFEFI